MMRAPHTGRLAGRGGSRTVLAMALAATAAAWWAARRHENDSAWLRFEREAVRMVRGVEDHLHRSETVLHAARALFEASDHVSEPDWHAFVDAIDLRGHNPAIIGVAYLEAVSPGGEAVVRYWDVTREGERFVGGAGDGSMGRAAALARSCEEDRAHAAQVASAEGARAVVYLPIYERGAPARTVEERRGAVRGWLCAELELRALGESVAATQLAEGVQCEVAAVDDSQARAGQEAREGRADISEVAFAGQRWQVRVSASNRMGPRESRWLSMVVLANGLGLSTLLFVVLRAFGRAHAIGERMAREMTVSLRESEERYRAAIRASRQIFYDWDVPSGAISLSGCVAEVMGWPKGSVASLDDWRQLVHADDRGAFEHECERVLRTNDLFHLEYRLRRADGTYATVIDSGCSFQDATDQPRTVGFITDITDRRRAEEERRQSDERFRMFFEHSGVPFLLLSDSRIIDCNEAALRLLGAPAKSAVMGLQPHEFSPEVQPDGRPSRERSAELLAQTGSGPSRFEWTFQRMNGEAFVVQTVYAGITVGDRRMVLAGWHDLTELRRAEQEGRRLQRVLQIAVDAMPQRVFWKDKTGAFLGCNRAFARDAGVESVEALVGKTDFDVSWRAYAHMYRADDFAVMASGRARVNFEERTTLAGGTERWLRTTKIPLIDEEGRTIGILGTFEDITDERAAKDELRRARDSAEAANRAKSEFLANMSHEIRTPMTAILGYADLLAEPGHSESDRHACIRTIRRNGEHLLAIINDILDLSKIEAGKMNIERLAVSPASLVRDVVEVMRPRADSKGLAIEAVFESPLPRTMVSDPTRVRQMLVNLMSNAVKFTERGSVRVRVAYEPTGAGHARVRFDVVDTGIGMNPDVLSRLFQPFTQADSSMTRRFGGTGLGLTVTRRLADLLGGDISVTSVPEAGSTFTIRIPVGSADPVELVDAAADPESRAEAAPTPTAPHRTLSGSILLVEDGPDNQRLLAHLLRGAGATVEIVENGQLALDRLKGAPPGTCPFDLVLMDMQMPVLDGYNATRHLRALGFKTPIVALTAHAMSGERERCLAAGCDDYATKPVARDALMALCARWMVAGRSVNAA